MEVRGSWVIGRGPRVMGQRSKVKYWNNRSKVKCQQKQGVGVRVLGLWLGIRAIGDSSKARGLKRRVICE